jgi:hypothetical protein
MIKLRRGTNNAQSERMVLPHFSHTVGLASGGLLLPCQGKMLPPVILREQSRAVCGEDVVNMVTLTDMSRIGAKRNDMLVSDGVRNGFLIFAELRPVVLCPEPEGIPRDSDTGKALGLRVSRLGYPVMKHHVCIKDARREVPLRMRQNL